MKRNKIIVLFALLIVVILGSWFSFLSYSRFKNPHLYWSKADLDPTLQKKVEYNMYTLQVEVEEYEISERVKNLNEYINEKDDSTTTKC